MNALYYALLFLGFAFTLAITLKCSLGGPMIPSKPWYRKPLAILAFSTLIVYAGLAVTGYLRDEQSKKQSKLQTQRLETRVESLDNKSRALDEQNRVLSDQIGDCNARMEALTAKFHAPAHFKRGMSEKSTTTDSITTTPKR